MSSQTRERAVQILTERNRLQRLVSALQKCLVKLENQTDRAWQQGNLERVNSFQQEIARCEGELIFARQALKEKAPTLEEIKADIREEEERVRQKVARALHERRLWQRSLTPHLLPVFSEYTDPPKFPILAGVFFVLLALAFFLLSSVAF